MLFRSGVEATLLNSFFLAHDMTHVIAGIDTSAQGEVALGAFQMAMDDNDVNVSAMISSFIIHEAGFGTPTTIAEAQHDVLLRPGAIDLLGQEIARGAACSSDFALVDHIALAPLPLLNVPLLPTDKIPCVAISEPPAMVMLPPALAAPITTRRDTANGPLSSDIGLLRIGQFGSRTDALDQVDRALDDLALLGCCFHISRCKFIFDICVEFLRQELRKLWRRVE
mgnify:CR=1 FL=1